MEVWFATQSPSPPNTNPSGLRNAQERALDQQLYQLIAKRRLRELALVGWERSLRELTQCLENTVCNETETDAKRSLMSHDRGSVFIIQRLMGRVVRTVRTLLRVTELSMFFWIWIEFGQVGVGCWFGVWICGTCWGCACGCQVLASECELNPD
jgi:hypothetical protein